MKAGHPGNWRWGWSGTALAFMLLVLVVLSSGCFSNPKPADQGLPGKTAKERRPLLDDRELNQVLVYYLTQDGSYLVPVTITFTPTREVAKVAVEKLIAGPQVNGLKGVMPDGVKLRDIYILDDQQTVYVDLTKELLQLKDNGQAERAIKALVLTLTSLGNARHVQVLVEGQAVAEVGGVKLDAPLSRPATINSLLKKDNQQGVQVYFNDASASFLVPVTVALPPGATGSDLPRAAMLALLAGPPPNSGLVRTVWPGTRLLDLKIEQGLATVNLSREVTGYGGGSAAETALLNSLLFTLTQFPEIDRVQLLIEGQKREYLPEGSVIDNPLSRPEQLNFIKH
ncbi:GerMN domain-containing protein [Neomoorella carbonis]|uniref:GerMN domain-containing protein n=1 Tax=Neomoorella carbonis TaxID=3062783 RepID=UPI00324A1A8F